MLARLPDLRHRLTTLLGATAIALAALAGSASPARASDDTLLRLLLGATAVAIVVHAATRSSGGMSGRPSVNEFGLPRQCRETLRIRGQHVAVYNAGCLRSAGVTRLPRHCHEVIRTNRGNRAVYRAQCLERAQLDRPYAAPRRQRQPSATLPGQCRMHYTYRGQRHVGYRANCLQGARLRDLPSTCRVRQRGGGHIYSAQCLRQHGFR
ncbi:MAG: hypothetical protein EA386_09975 [Rhodobacteraceae bacterium]|nr:MAG: hypothetical protein EA386_09975 [Paracoccaceae bacterium]